GVASDGVIRGVIRGVASDGVIRGVIRGVASGGVIRGVASDGVIRGVIRGVASDGVIRGVIRGVASGDEMDICSLAIATSIHAYEVLKRKPGVVCKWAGNAALAATIADPQPAAVQEQAFAASRPGEWRTGGRSPTRSPRKLEQPKPTTSVVCYNCGLRGHVAAGCRAPRQRAAGPRRDDDQGHKSSQQNPASRGTSHVRSTNTAHSGRRFAVGGSRLGAGGSIRRGGPYVARKQSSGPNWPTGSWLRRPGRP
ncbi:unnamed protein product, partial [Lampetra fluviatilis]